MADNKETVDAEKESENSVDKKRHSCLDALKYFLRHNTLLFWSIFMLFLSIVIGTFAILITQTIQVGKEAFYAMTTDPFGPNNFMYEEDFTNNLIFIDVILYSSLVTGIILFVYTFISLLNISILASLIYGLYPWYAANWNCTRRHGDQLLINSGIRTLAPDKQLEYMNDKQLNDVSRYYNQFHLLHPLTKAK